MQGAIESAQTYTGPTTGTFTNAPQGQQYTAPTTTPKAPETQGIVESAQTYKAPTTTPITTEVDAGTETVENRLNDMTAKGSRYTNLAASDARRQANTRGLVNSTMAGAAGTEAAIRAALPIAQQDAQTYTQTRFKNQDVGNRFLENRQNTNLNKESAAHASGLKLGEMDEASRLTRGEMRLGDELQSGQMRLGSSLSREESTLLNELQMKRDNNAASLSAEENQQLADLQAIRDAALSGLSREENELLNDLTMKRDQGLAELTAEENAQLNELQMKRDSALSEQSMERDSHLNQLSIDRDNNSAELNKELSAFENTLQESRMVLDAELKTAFEQTMQDDRFGDEAKMQIVTTMNNIVRDTQQQIVTIGTSDRSAKQQAAAIKAAEANRDATLAVYQKLLDGFNDWDWGTDFTPGGASGAGSAPTSGSASDVMADAAAAQEPVPPRPTRADFGGPGGWGMDKMSAYNRAVSQWEAQYGNR
jgi:hypothetical protein